MKLLLRKKYRVFQQFMDTLNLIITNVPLKDNHNNIALTKYQLVQKFAV